MFADVPTGVWLPILCGLITVVFSLPTVRRTLRGQDRPSWVSWAVWTSTTGLATGTTLSAGAWVAAAVPAAAFVRCVLMFFATIYGLSRYRDGRDATSRLDWTCLILCALTGTAWAATGADPQWATAALVAAIATDAIASGPTWRLAWRREEDALNWGGALVNAFGTLAVTRGVDVAGWAYPLYETTLTVTLTALILVRGKRGTGGLPAVAPPRWFLVGVIATVVGVLGVAWSSAVIAVAGGDNSGLAPYFLTVCGVIAALVLALLHQRSDAESVRAPATGASPAAVMATGPLADPDVERAQNFARDAQSFASAFVAVSYELDLQRLPQRRRELARYVAGPHLPGSALWEGLAARQKVDYVFPGAVTRLAPGVVRVEVRVGFTCYPSTTSGAVGESRSQRLWVIVRRRDDGDLVVDPDSIRQLDWSDGLAARPLTPDIATAGRTPAPASKFLAATPLPGP